MLPGDSVWLAADKQEKEGHRGRNARGLCPLKLRASSRQFDGQALNSLQARHPSFRHDSLGRRLLRAYSGRRNSIPSSRRASSPTKPNSSKQSARRSGLEPNRKASRHLRKAARLWQRGLGSLAPGEPAGAIADRRRLIAHFDALETTIVAVCSLPPLTPWQNSPRP